MSKNQEPNVKKTEKASGKGEGPMEKSPEDLISPFYATDEGKRQAQAKMIQQEAIENAPKSEKKSKKTKAGLEEDPRRNYDDSEYQKKIIEINTKVSSSNDPNEKAKLQKEMAELSEAAEEQQEEESQQSMFTQGGTVGSPTSTTLGGQAFGQTKK